RARGTCDRLWARRPPSRQDGGGGRRAGERRGGFRGRSNRADQRARHGHALRRGGVGPDMNALEGQVALVTGAAGGIGGAVTDAFVEAGARVLAVDRVEAASGDAYVCDVTRTEEVEAAVVATVDRFGGLDVVFNGAGISGRSLGDGPVDRCAEEGGDAVLE